MKPSKIKDQVKAILQRDPQARDNDALLMGEVWKAQIGVGRLLTLSAYEAIQLLAGGILPSPESIRRSRQKWQEIDESLRGERYNERHDLEEVTIHDLKKFTP